MNGEAAPVDYDNLSSTHDVEQFGVYKDQFVKDERVVLSEKLHGSQINAYASLQSTDVGSAGIVHNWVSTKNYNIRGLQLLESEKLLLEMYQGYWSLGHDRKRIFNR